MIVLFGNCELMLPNKIEQCRIDCNTSQLAFVKKHASDIGKEIGALYSILERIGKPNIIFDVMAGSGFSGKVFLDVFPKLKLILNDLDKKCFGVLKNNFPMCDVYNRKAEDIEISETPDLVFVDFNNFTLFRFKMGVWKLIMDRINSIHPKYYLFTDSSCYQEKFGKFDCVLYYEQLSEYLSKRYGLVIISVAMFGNAALVLTEYKIVSSITKVKSKPIHLRFRHFKGLF